MIHSMTAFARTEYNLNEGQLICEIRSVNHRYLELHIHLPENMRSLEMAIREQLKHSLTRGKVDCTIKLKSMDNNIASPIILNLNMIEQLDNAKQEIAKKISIKSDTNFIDILNYQGVVQKEELNVSQIQTEVQTCISDTISALLSAREREGSKIAELCISRFKQIADEVNKIKIIMPSILTTHKSKLQERLAEITNKLDQDRLEQEMLYLAQKIDVTEEIERTEAHIEEAQRIFIQGGSIGRRLDFILQEFNREANTLASKSINQATTHAAVEMKVLIEQIREQIQNLE